MAGVDKICYVSLGSNLPDGEGYVRRTIKWLSTVMLSVKSSYIYTTPSVSAGDDSTYFNAVARCLTSLSAKELELRFKHWESDCGRRHESCDNSVAIDVDLVIYDGVVLRPRDAGCDYFLIGMNCFQ